MGGAKGRLISTPDRVKAVELIDEARVAGARLKTACDILGISDRTYQRWTRGGSTKEDKRPIMERPTPKNKLSETERAEVIKIANGPEFVDLTPHQIVPKLADKGEYIASESTIYRILREEKMNTHRGRSHAPVKKVIPTHIATGPNQVWTWDITWLNAAIAGKYFKLYLMLDMFSRLIVAHEVWETERAQYAEQLIRRAVLAQNIQGRLLVLHSDNGSPMKAATFQATLEKLGVQSSFSRPRVSNDNPYSESLFKTMKYRPQYPFRGFATVEEARKWVNKFVTWYNKIHLHSGINYLTPYQRHHGFDESIMENRIKVYEKARAKHPERWSRSTRNWVLPDYVALNPLIEKELSSVTGKVARQLILQPLNH